MKSPTIALILIFGGVLLIAGCAEPQTTTPASAPRLVIPSQNTSAVNVSAPTINKTPEETSATVNQTTPAKNCHEWFAEAGFYTDNIPSDKYPWNYTDPVLQVLYYAVENDSSGKPQFQFTNKTIDSKRPFYVLNKENVSTGFALYIQFWDKDQTLLSARMYQAIPLQANGSYYGSLDYAKIYSLAPYGAVFFHPYLLTPPNPCVTNPGPIIPQRTRYAMFLWWLPPGSK